MGSWNTYLPPGTLLETQNLPPNPTSIAHPLFPAARALPSSQSQVMLGTLLECPSVWS